MIEEAAWAAAIFVLFSFSRSYTKKWKATLKDSNCGAAREISIHHRKGEKP